MTRWDRKAPSFTDPDGRTWLEATRSETNEGIGKWFFGTDEAGRYAVLRVTEVVGGRVYFERVEGFGAWLVYKLYRLARLLGLV